MNPSAARTSNPTAIPWNSGLADSWLQLIQHRLASGRTGARWQLARLEALRGDLAALTLDYAHQQAGGAPAHLWR